MTPTQRFLLFIVLSIVALVVGYVVRRRRGDCHRLSKDLHYITMVAIWPLAAMLSVWRLPLELQMVWLVVMQLAAVGGMAWLALRVGRTLGATRAQQGVLAVGASLPNSGFTLGAYLCYSTIDPAEQALAYAMMLTVIMQVLGVLIIFPLCRRYGTQTPIEGSTGRMIWVNLTDLRSLSLHFAVIGVALAAVEVPFPAVIDDWYLLDVLFFVGGIATYLGIGLQIYFSDLFHNVRFHAALAAIRFMVIPICGIALIGLSLATAVPVDDVLLKVIIVQSFVPAAVMTVMLPNLFGMDVRLAGMVWVWNTALFVVLVLPLLLLGLAAWG
ncbi:MAG: hypothetical protein JJU36_17565 [Phycisphaeraceae bacterium]|nr:hypothetical protein [Phycisphaeraceae bacterium]